MYPETVGYLRDSSAPRGHLLVETFLMVHRGGGATVRGRGQGCTCCFWGCMGNPQQSMWPTSPGSPTGATGWGGSPQSWELLKNQPENIQP